MQPGSIASSKPLASSPRAGAGGLVTTEEGEEVLTSGGQSTAALSTGKQPSNPLSLFASKVWRDSGVAWEAAQLASSTCLLHPPFRRLISTKLRHDFM